MKYLNDYTQQKQTDLFQSTGAFFAFSNSQLQDKAVDGVEYVSLGAGLISPKNKAQFIVEQLEKIQSEAIKLDLEENGKHRVIRRELYNHECFYTGCIEDCVMALDGYNITAEEIEAVYLHTLNNEKTCM